MTNPFLKIRKELNITRDELSAMAKIPQGSLSHYERGTRHPLVAIAFKVIKFAAKHGIEIKLHEFYEDLRG